MSSAQHPVWVKYIGLFKKWHGALILKVFGKSVNYGNLEQCLHDLWPLEKRV